MLTGPVLQAFAALLAMCCLLLLMVQRRAQGRARERTQRLLEELEDGKVNFRALKFRSDAQEVLMEASNRFLRTERGEVDRCMQTTLRELGVFLEVKRASVYRFDVDGGTVTHRWVEGSRMSRNDGEGFLPTPQIEAVVREGRPLRVGSPTAVPEDAKDLKAFLHRRGTRALLAVPIARGDDRTLGFLLLETARNERAWRDEEVEIVSALAELIALELTFRESEELARSRQELLDAAMSAAPIVLLLLDGDGRILFAGGTALADAGQAPRQLLGRSAKELAADSPAALSLLHRGLAGEEFREEVTIGGRVLEVSSRAVSGEEAAAGGRLLLLATDITARVHAEKELVRGRLHDAVTGLPNRTLLLERLREDLDAGTASALLLIGLDRWAPLQDALGLDAATRFTEGAAAALREAVPWAAVIARTDPEVYALLVPEHQSADAAMRVQSLFQQGIEVDGKRQSTGLSIGVSRASDREADQADWLLRAHTALQAARQRGGGCTERWVPAMHSRVQASWKLEEELAEAIRDDRLEAWMQPIVDLETGKPVAFEALARWPHPREGMLSPGRFIPLAEENGMIEAIGWSMLDKAAAELTSAVEGRPQHANLYVSVNVSSRQLTDPQFLDRVREVLGRHGLKPGNLQLEITESDAVGPNEDIIPLLDSVRDAGVRVSLDDFGTGYSSLSYLNRLPADSMKVDRSFVVHMGSAAAGRKVITSILLLAQGLSLAAIAEGIETEEQRQQLLALGCRYGQGFLFSRPLPPGEAREWLADPQRAATGAGRSSK